MKKMHAKILFNKIAIFTAVGVMTLAITACERQPKQQQEAKQVTATAKLEDSNAFKSKVEKINLVVPQCEGQFCPEIELYQLNSNYPELDKAIETYSLNYVKNLVQGFDLDKNNPEDTNNTTASASPIMEMTEQRQDNKNTVQLQENSAKQSNAELQGYIDQFMQLANEVKLLGSTAQLNLYIKPQILNPNHSVVTVVVNASNYIGGAHGSSAQQYLNFELANKSILNLDQIIQTGQRKAFNDLAYAAFEQWIKEIQPDVDVKKYQELWKFALSENFYLSANGLILQYGEYEIGPYAVGLPRLILSYDQLQGILKPQYLPIPKEKIEPKVINNATNVAGNS